MDIKTRTLPPLPVLATEPPTTELTVTLLECSPMGRLQFTFNVAQLLDALSDALPDLPRGDLERLCRLGERSFAELKWRKQN